MPKTKDTDKERLIIGISGASGAQFGIKALTMLQSSRIETHLVLSQAAEMTIALETDLTAKDVRAMADVNHSTKDIAATIASGSFKSMGMLIAPCSVRTMSEIHTGVTSSLLTRAADVTLKERRPLVLMVRETPLHTGHLRTMTGLSEMGAIIAPPMPAFYTNPRSIDDMVTQTVARCLELFGIDTPDIKRWKDGN